MAHQAFGMTDKPVPDSHIDVLEAMVANIQSHHSPGWFMVRMPLSESMVVASWHFNFSKTEVHRDVVDAFLIRRFEEPTVAV